MARLKTIGVAVLILIIAFFFTPLVQFIAAPLVVHDPLKKADTVVVLSGGWESKGTLGKSTLERYDYGIKLFQKGYGKYIIFSGGNLRGTPSEAELMMDMALNEGFPDEAVFSEGSSESTWENTLFVKKILMEEDLKSVILVTSPYHALRAKTMFKDKGIDVIVAPVPDSEFYNTSGKEQIRMAKIVFLEYVKYGLYKLNITR